MRELGILLEELALKHNVPGAALAVLDGDDLHEVATGVVNTSTGVETTTDTLFQIGSITKVWTATQVMQLADQGAIDLDAPVREYLPEFALSDTDAASSITVRQLLCHTSGMDADRFVDTGRGDDCIKEYVATCRSLKQIAPPGTFFSYSNVGYVVAGRLIEHETDRVWDAALKEDLIEPLGLRHTVTLPEEALLHQAAVGHVDPTNSGHVRPAPIWTLPRSVGPAGLICCNPADVITFVQMHLNDGIAQERQRLLSSDSVMAMQTEQVKLIDTYTLGSGWGLGWIRYNWDGLPAIGHDGGTLGQLAFLRIAPERRFAICLLTNSFGSGPLAKELIATVVADRLGVALPQYPNATANLPENPEKYAGIYERENTRIQIDVINEELAVTIELGGPAASMLPPTERVPLNAINATDFLMRRPGSNRDAALVFFDFDAGRPRYVHSGGRATPRVA